VLSVPGIVGPFVGSRRAVGSDGLFGL